MSPETGPKETIHAGALVDALVHRQLLHLLLDEGRSFREWLEDQEEQYLKTHLQ